MDNETTRLISDGDINNVKSNIAPNEEKRKINPAATAAGGFVAGAAAGVGATAYATRPGEPLPVEEVNEEGNKETEGETPEQETPIVEENVLQEESYPHENVSTPKSAPVSHSEPTAHQTASAGTIGVTPQEVSVTEEIPVNAEMIDVTPVDNEIRVLGVEAVQTEDGHVMNVALLENAGDHALLVDVDNNGRMDLLVHDDNRDGMIQEQEVHDVSGAGIELGDLLTAQATQDADMYYASNDDMPDYINDADSIMEV
ncbi:MAG: hypothetical protein K2H76_03495 [Muribaculaceae bacterium]|nr:hypothetical protein [Muribaculaceae bacterium]